MLTNLIQTFPSVYNLTVFVGLNLTWSFAGIVAMAIAVALVQYRLFDGGSLAYPIIIPAWIAVVVATVILFLAIALIIHVDGPANLHYLHQ